MMIHKKRKKHFLEIYIEEYYFETLVLNSVNVARNISIFNKPMTSLEIKYLKNPANSSLKFANFQIKHFTISFEGEKNVYYFHKSFIQSNHSRECYKWCS